MPGVYLKTPVVTEQKEPEHPLSFATLMVHIEMSATARIGSSR